MNIDLILSFVCFVLLIVTFFTARKYKDKYEIEVLNSRSAQQEAAKYKIIAQEYLKKLNNLESNGVLGNMQTQILEAVKYAVIKSHPDNGGNTEDFIRFNECYKKLRKKMGE